MTNTNPDQPRGHKDNAGGYSAHLHNQPEPVVKLVAPDAATPAQTASLDAILTDVYDVVNRTELRGDTLIVDFWEPGEDGRTEFVTRVVLDMDGKPTSVLLAATDAPESIVDGDWVELEDGEERRTDIAAAVGRRIDPLPEHPAYDDWARHIRQLQARGRVTADVDPEYVGLHLAANPGYADDDIPAVCDQVMAVLNSEMDEELSYTRRVVTGHRDQI